MLVAEYGQFSQVAKFDSHHGFRDAVRSFKTFMCDIPVAQSLRLAFGIIGVKGRGERDWVIPREWTTLPDMNNDRFSTEVWSAYALPQQLKNIQYSFERFAGTGELAVADYSQRKDAFEADDVMVLKTLMSSSGCNLGRQVSGDDFRARAREFLNATHAIAAIRPWGLLPVLPAHMVVAIKLILVPSYKTRAFTVSVLQRELRMIPDKTFRPEGRTGEELSRLLGLIVGDKDDFSGVGNYNSLAYTYHEGMCMVFRHQGINLDDIRISLAAAVGSKLFWRRDGAREGAEGLEPFQENTRRYLERCYLQAEPTKTSWNVPGWAIDVYAGYLWLWITQAIPADPDIISYFRRRVFLA